MNRPILILAALCAALSGVASAETKAPRAKHAKPAAAAPAPDCPRASYKGDPVCFGWDSSNDLPTPSANAIAREKVDDVRINDDITITGADTKRMKKTPVDQYLNNPQASPHAQDIGGAASVQYKF